jgi:hypothetical protein
MTVFGPSTEACTYILLAPSFATYFLRATSQGWSNGRRLLLAAAYFLVTYPQIPLRLPAAGFLSHHAAQCFGGLLFASLVLAEPTPASPGA